MPKKRPPIPKKIEDELLVKCKHCCCICEKFGVEIHHMDGNPSNNRENNLIPLCSNCANIAHVDFPPAARIHGISPGQLRLYKKNWIEKINSPIPTIVDGVWANEDVTKQTFTYLTGSGQIVFCTEYGIVQAGRYENFDWGKAIVDVDVGDQFRVKVEVSPIAGAFPK